MEQINATWEPVEKELLQPKDIFTRAIEQRRAREPAPFTLENQLGTAVSRVQVLEHYLNSGIGNKEELEVEWKEQLKLINVLRNEIELSEATSRCVKE